MNTKKGGIIRKLLEYISVALIYVIAYFISGSQHAITGIFMIVAGIGSYIYFAFNGERNFLKMNAVFSIAWVVTIGISQMMLNPYQRSWELVSWICVCLAHLSFLVANDWAHRAFPFFERVFNFNKLNNSKFPLHYERKDNRLFWIALVTSAIGIAFFVANIVIKGYVPFFASAENDKAYVEFYTRLHIFVVASMVSGGLAYYCLRKCELSIIKKIISILIIVIMIFAIPILLVQRGTFIAVALILTTVIYLGSKKRRFILLLACLVLMLGVYQVGTSLRSYSEAQLVYLFQTEQDEINKEKKEKKEGEDDKEKTKVNKKPAEVIKIKLTPGQAYFYAYLSVSHDNFNCIVSEKEENTWGLFQLIPFNVLLRIDSINEKLAEVKIPQVTTYLNTNNLIGYAYYDFGLIGVVGLMLLWSFGFGIVEAFERKYKGPFVSLIYGVCMLPVALCFFNAWMSYFTTWLLWGTVCLMFLFASFTRKKHIQKALAKKTIGNGETNK